MNVAAKKLRSPCRYKEGQGFIVFFNDCHGKNTFSNSSLLCMYDELLSMALNFNVYSSFAQKVLGPGQRNIIIVDMQIANSQRNGACYNSRNFSHCTYENYLSFSCLKGRLLQEGLRFFPWRLHRDQTSHEP